jgi:hypothetical protein
MNHRAAVLLLIASCARAPPIPETPASSPLVGSWELERVVAIRPGGEATISRWGRNPSGIITYTADGHMAAQIMGDPRPTLRDPDHPTPEESAAMLDTYLAYAGTYDYDPATKVVIHHVRMSVDPSEVGVDMPRKVELDGDRVTLTATPYTLRGEKVFNKLTWRRLRQAMPPAPRG